MPGAHPSTQSQLEGTPPTPWLILILCSEARWCSHTPRRFRSCSTGCTLTLAVAHATVRPADRYLTFDDGPNPTATPLLLDLLGLERCRPPSS